jgi:hypothetical protein
MPDTVSSSSRRASATASSVIRGSRELDARPRSSVNNSGRRSDSIALKDSSLTESAARTHWLAAAWLAGLSHHTSVTAVI